MEMQKVESSNINKVGYDEETGTLHVEFHRNKVVYRYVDVPKTVFEELVASPSVGGYFHKNVIGKYDFVKG